MGYEEKNTCIICGRDVEPSYSKFCNGQDDRSGIFKLWNNECAKTVCEILVGNENLPVFLDYFQDYSFCSSCDQDVRDIQYFVYQINAFQNKIHTLTRIIHSRLLLHTEDGSKSTENEQLKTRIVTVLTKGPNCLKLYTHQQIAEIIYKMASDKCSMDAKKEKVQRIGDKVDKSRKILNPEYNNVEMDSEIKTELEENLMDDCNNMEDHNYINEDFLNHNSYSKEAEIKPDFINAGTSRANPLTKLNTNWKDNQNYVKVNLVWKDEVANSGSKVNKYMLSKAEDTYWDGSMHSDDEDWTPYTPYKKRVKKSPKSKKPNISDNKIEQDEDPQVKNDLLDSKQGKRVSHKSLYEIKRNEERKAKRLAARISKSAAINEEERLARKKDAEERRRLAQPRYNQRKRDKRLAEKRAKSFMCPAENCGEFFRRKNEADGHFRKIHEGCTEDAYHCEDCPEKFSEYKLLNEHIRKREINGRCLGKEECKFCGKHYLTEDELKVHLSEAHTGPNPFMCGFCDTEYTNSLDLRKHTMTYHPDVVNTVCDICGETILMSKIKAHKNRHNNKNERFPCVICSKSYLSSHSLKIHQDLVHNVEGKKIEMLVCEVCGKEFPGKYKLRAHLLRHKKHLPCKLCDRMFQCASHLRDHETSHIGIRNFFCKTCGKAFLTGTILKGHELTHQEGYVPRKFNRRQKPAVRVDKPKPTD